MKQEPPMPLTTLMAPVTFALFLHAQMFRVQSMDRRRPSA